MLQERILAAKISVDVDVLVKMFYINIYDIVCSNFSRPELPVNVF